MCPVRGVDARVPQDATADVPRTSDSTRPPDTGGTPPPPNTSETGPRIPAGNIPSDTGGPPLSTPRPSVLITSSNLTRPCRAGDRLSLPLRPPTPPRHESSRNEGQDDVVAHQELGRSRVPSPTPSSSSASSGAEAENCDMLGVDLPNLDADSADVGGEEQILRPTIRLPCTRSDNALSILAGSRVPTKYG